jgi:hypothetical protein
MTWLEIITGRHGCSGKKKDLPLWHRICGIFLHQSPVQKRLLRLSVIPLFSMCVFAPQSSTFGSMEGKSSRSFVSIATFKV